MALSITHSYVSAVPDAGDASLVQPSDWNDTHDISGLGTGVEAALAVNLGSAGAVLISTSTIPLTIGTSTIASGNDTRILYNNAGVLGQYTLTGTGTVVAMQTAPSFLTSITTPRAVITQGTLTDPATNIDATVTWNDAADTFTAWKLNVTNTNSASASMLMDLQVGGASQFYVRKDGFLVLTGGGFAPVWSYTDGSLALISTGVALGTGKTVAWTTGGYSDTQDVILARDAANTLALRNSTTAQTFNIYGTWTDASNYERLSLYYATAGGFSGNYVIETAEAGSGTGRSLVINSASATGAIAFYNQGTANWLIYDNKLLAATDNVYDIGASGATRPRTGYFGTSVVTPVATITQGTITDVAPLINATTTWNDAADTFTAIKLNVTNTNSATGSILMDLQVDTVSKFKFLRRGYDADTPALSTAGQMSIGAANENLFFGGSTASNAHGVVNSALLAIRSGSYLGWSSSSSDANTASDVKLFRDAAATLALRNGTTAQTFNIYATWTDASNYERLQTDYDSGNTRYRIFTNKAGTGAVRAMFVGANNGLQLSGNSDNAISWNINTSHHFYPQASNTQDLGLSGTTVRTGYFGTSVVTPIATITQGTITDVAPLINATTTWNDAADTFTAIKLNVTNTNSASASLLMDLQVGAASKFAVARSGNIVAYDGFQINAGAGGDFNRVSFTGSYLTLCDGVVFTLSGGAPGSRDVFLLRDSAANTLALRNGTSSQTFNHYDTYTSSTDYHRVAIKTARATLASVSGATVTATGLIPDGAVVVGVTTKVTVTISGGTTTGFQVGTGGDPDRWGEAVALTAGTSLDNTNWTAGTIEAFTAATDVIVTAVGGNFTGTGTIYLSVQYLIGQCD
jgi:hypothetical protein